MNDENEVEFWHYIAAFVVIIGGLIIEPLTDFLHGLLWSIL